MPLFADFASAAIGLALQEVYAPASLTPVDYSSLVTQKALPLLSFGSSFVRHLSSSPSAVRWLHFTLWSLDDAVLEIGVGASQCSLAVRVVSSEAMSPEETKFALSLMGQTSEASLPQLEAALQALLEGALTSIEGKAQPGSRPVE
jgi:hypothetical protein